VTDLTDTDDTDTEPSAVTAATNRPASAPAPASDQRQRILDRALELMSQRGSVGTSMRQLADACGLNVATLYHYFPSKAVLLQALIERQHYGERMAAGEPAIDPELPARERLAAFVSWLWTETEDELAILRLVFGEGVRGDATAQSAARALIVALDAQLSKWVADGFPELGRGGVDPAVVGRVIRRHLLALVAESLATGSTGSHRGRHDARTHAADDLAMALFG
jgi:AcrR family transcriptional regulator